MNVPGMPNVSNRLIVVLAAVIVAVLVADGVAAATKGGSKKSTSAHHHSTASPTPSPTPTKPGDIVLFTDDFDDPGTGWANEKVKSGSSFRYVHGKYVVVLKDRFADEFLYAPEPIAVKAMKANMTAAQTAGFATGSGFGMVCEQRDDRTDIAYDFLLVRSGTSTVHWYIRRRDGLPKHEKDTTLTKGDLHLRLGPGLLKLSEECVTKNDDRTTNLTFLVNGRAIGHARNTVTKDLPRGGWRGGILVSNAGVSTTVTATHFEVRSTALTSSA